MSPAEPDSAPDLTATYAIVQRICTELERTALLAGSELRHTLGVTLELAYRVRGELDRLSGPG